VTTDDIETTERLIARLTADAGPVVRLRHPLVRACLWLGGATVAATLLVYGAADMNEFMIRAQEGRQKIELTATLLTGLLAVIAAFELSLPDRSRAWLLLPLPALAAWLATSGLGCLNAWIAGAPTDLRESSECFLILIGTSLPLGLALLWMLRRAKPLNPVSVAAMGGLGVAGIAAFVLQFFHPFDVTFIDFGIHALAILIVIGVASAANREQTV
jgi:hypothetical protein